MIVPFSAPDQRGLLGDGDEDQVGVHTDRHTQPRVSLVVLLPVIIPGFRQPNRVCEGLPVTYTGNVTGEVPLYEPSKYTDPPEGSEVIAKYPVSPPISAAVDAVQKRLQARTRKTRPPVMS